MRRKDLNDPDLTLDEMMRRWPDTIAVFLRYNMLCPGCPVSPFHTLETACAEYHLDLDGFLDELTCWVSSAGPR